MDYPQINQISETRSPNPSASSIGIRSPRADPAAEAPPDPSIPGINKPDRIDESSRKRRFYYQSLGDPQSRSEFLLHREWISTLEVLQIGEAEGERSKRTFNEATTKKPPSLTAPEKSTKRRDPTRMPLNAYFYYFIAAMDPTSVNGIKKVKG
ncbi:hypothetical protein B296_00049419 [Ensete ventricosum]|uniref:Uncharacterized protein n=1 Tax=Ensete ventricosum TaxID=4639 RepID=A0A426YQS0_ENSVE|nr:hypothetical protein B296_00049419 [Ensete ventricosum]